MAIPRSAAAAPVVTTVIYAALMQTGAREDVVSQAKRAVGIRAVARSPNIVHRAAPVSIGSLRPTLKSPLL